jgi:hypothetical protein
MSGDRYTFCSSKLVLILHTPCSHHLYWSHACYHCINPVCGMSYSLHIFCWIVLACYILCGGVQSFGLCCIL